MVSTKHILLLTAIIFIFSIHLYLFSNHHDRIIEGNKKNGHEGMVWLPDSEFWIGPDGKFQSRPEHSHSRWVRLHHFWIDKNSVTPAQFATFVKATGYISTVKHASSPNGTAAQMSYQDAMAYAKWVGKRLPTEAEWTYVVQSGIASHFISSSNGLHLVSK